MTSPNRASGVRYVASLASINGTTETYSVDMLALGDNHDVEVVNTPGTWEMRYGIYLLTSKLRGDYDVLNLDCMPFTDMTLHLV